MLQLSGKLLSCEGLGQDVPRHMLRVSTNPDTPKLLAKDMAFLVGRREIPAGYRCYMALERDRDLLSSLDASKVAKLVLPESARFLGDGDVIRIHMGNQAYRVLYRRRSHHNSILLTERCDHYCLMCSQPPKDVADDWIMDDAEKLVRMLPLTTQSLGFTGGEPTLYGSRLVDLLRLTNSLLPRTSVHILSNGRRFADARFAADYASVGHPDIMVGIPLYSDDPARHNYVVQAADAFEETVKGILNLKRLRQRVELRVVLHKQTVERLEQLATFIARNLLFVDQVALMGLEITGFTKGNLDKLWIDPTEYKTQLANAVKILNTYKIRTLVYNHQLCVVDDSVRPFCVKSISDWKNDYLPVCEGCTMRANCGGFFSSSVKHRHSDFIEPLLKTA